MMNVQTISIRSSCKMLDAAEIQFANKHLHLFSQCKCFDTKAMNTRVAMDSSTVRVATAEMSPISTCPGISACSDHVVFCEPNTKCCTCEESFTGGNCSLRTCEKVSNNMLFTSTFIYPLWVKTNGQWITCVKGLAWFGYPSANNFAHDKEVECSNMGLCYRSMSVGEWACNDGFFGAVCKYTGGSGFYFNSLSYPNYLAQI